MLLLLICEMKMNNLGTTVTAHKWMKDVIAHKVAIIPTAAIIVATIITTGVPCAAEIL